MDSFLIFLLVTLVSTWPDTPGYHNCSLLYTRVKPSIGTLEHWTTDTEFNIHQSDTIFATFPTKIHPLSIWVMRPPQRQNSGLILANVKQKWILSYNAMCKQTHIWISTKAFHCLIEVYRYQYWYEAQFEQTSCSSDLCCQSIHQPFYSSPCTLA